MDSTSPRRTRNPSALDARYGDLDRLVRRFLKDWGVPGAAVGIVKGNRTVYAEGFGLRDLRRRLPVSENTLFGIASCAKSFTATASAMLVDEGLLDWDRPIREYLPFFKLRDPVASRRATVRDLLSHRTGLPRHDKVLHARESKARLCRRLRHLEPSGEFRGKFEYTNLMYPVAALLIEHLSGTTWWHFVSDRILAPLGMTATRCWDGEVSDLEDLSLGYVQRKGGKTPVPGHVRPGLHDGPHPAAPDDSLLASVPDMCRWLRFHLNRGKVGNGSVVSEESLLETHTPQVVVPPDPVPFKELLDKSYGMGWMIRPYRGHRLVAHGGYGAGYHCNMSFMPTESVGVVVLTNRFSPEWVVPLGIYDRLLGMKPVPWNARMRRISREEAVRREERKPGGQASPPSKDYSGNYSHPGYGRLSVSLEQSGLTMLRCSIVYRLEHLEGDVFRMIQPDLNLDVEVSFGRDRRGKVGSLAIPFEPSVDEVVFERV